MRKYAKKLATLTPAFALMGAGGAGAANGAPDTRAITLDVIETADEVEVQVIALSQVSQQVQFDVQLVGASNARSRGDTGISAGERHVLSRLKGSVSDTWCATVQVTEGTGLKYMLTAGDC